MREMLRRNAAVFTFSFQLSILMSVTLLLKSNIVLSPQSLHQGAQFRLLRCRNPRRCARMRLGIRMVHRSPRQFVGGRWARLESHVVQKPVAIQCAIGHSHEFDDHRLADVLAHIDRALLPAAGVLFAA